jgi:hypothetical protein
VDDEDEDEVDAVEEDDFAESDLDALFAGEDSLFDSVFEPFEEPSLADGAAARLSVR